MTLYFIDDYRWVLDTNRETNTDFKSSSFFLKLNVPWFEK